MSDIDQFLSVVANEYVKDASDRRVSIGDFAPMVHETEDYLSFYLEESQAVLFDDDGKTKEGKEAPSALNFSKWSLNQYCRRIKPEGAPLTADYIRDCTPNLAIANLKTWTRANAEKEVFIRLKKDQNKQTHIRAVLSGTWAPIDANYVASKLKPFLGQDTIEFSVTEKYWRIVRWSQNSQPYAVGFRIMGSEVGAMPHVRVDTVLGLWSGKGYYVVPILKDGKPVGRLTYNSSGAKAANSLTDAITKGLSQTGDLVECLEARGQETLRFPQDEFIDIVDDRSLPSSVRLVVVERPQLFEDTKSKLDMVRLLSKLASETTGYAQIRIEEAAALYALTGRSRDRVNRNEEVWED